MGKHAPQASQVLICSSRIRRRTCSGVPELFPVLVHLQGSCALRTVEVDDRSTDVFTLNMFTDPESTRKNGLHGTIVSFAPNFATKAGRARPHWGHQRQLHADPGFPRDSTNLEVKQADTVMLSYPLGVQMDQEMLANDPLYHCSTIQQ